MPVNNFQTIEWGKHKSHGISEIVHENNYNDGMQKVGNLWTE